MLQGGDVAFINAELFLHVLAIDGSVLVADEQPTVPGSAFVFLNVFTGLVVTRLVAHVVKFVKQLLVCCSQNAQKSCLAYLWLPQYGMLWKFSYTRRTT